MDNRIQVPAAGIVSLMMENISKYVDIFDIIDIASCYGPVSLVALTKNTRARTYIVCGLPSSTIDKMVHDLSYIVLAERKIKLQRVFVPTEEFLKHTWCSAKNLAKKTHILGVYSKGTLKSTQVQYVKMEAKKILDEISVFPDGNTSYTVSTDTTVHSSTERIVCSYVISAVIDCKTPETALRVFGMIHGTEVQQDTVYLCFLDA